MPLRTRCGTSRLPCMSLGVRAQGLGPRGGGTALAITICSVLPSVPYDAVGPPKFILLSRLNIQPARLPVNASPLLSRTTTHDSGPIWFATPSLGGTCTRETYRLCRRTIVSNNTNELKTRAPGHPRPVPKLGPFEIGHKSAASCLCLRPDQGPWALPSSWAGRVVTMQMTCDPQKRNPARSSRLW